MQKEKWPGGARGWIYPGSPRWRIPPWQTPLRRIPRGRRLRSGFPVADSSAADSPVTDSPAADSPAADSPVADSPAADAPAPPQKSPAPSATPTRIPPRKWFFTFMCMNIPIIGWIYLLTKAFGKKETPLKDFSRAYLLYKLVFLAVALVILGIAVYIGLGILDKLLAYMEML